MRTGQSELDRASIGPDGRPVYLFTPGIALTPPYLAGREYERKKISRAIVKMHGAPSGGRPILLFGPRGMGKTVLMSTIETNPPYNADIRQTTPAMGLADINNIPRMLLSERGQWNEFIPKISLNIPGIGVEFDMREHDAAEHIKHQIITKCSREPMVLIVDEAHRLSEGTGTFFLNYIQDIIKRANLLLVLSGTPDLTSVIRRLGATYITRGESLPVGNLSDEAAWESIEIPIKMHNASIDPGVLRKVVEDCGGFPHFLQIWGENLWCARGPGSWDRIGEKEYANAIKKVEKDKLSLYSHYFSDLDLLEHHAPAAALALKFETRDPVDLHEARAIISYFVAKDRDGESRDNEASKVLEYLLGHDVLWIPSGVKAEVSMPSFHSHIVKQFERRMESMLALFPEQELDDRHLMLLRQIKEHN